jgi:hypothetical protein
MINYLLKYPNIYRFYQKLIRKQHDEYNFINFIIKETTATKDIRMLDLCSGDSYILECSHKYIKNYLGIDNNPFYLKKCKKKWKQFNFINLDLNNFNNIKIYKKFNPNFIFMMGLKLKFICGMVFSKTNSFQDVSDLKKAESTCEIADFIFCVKLTFIPIEANSAMIASK